MRARAACSLQPALCLLLAAALAGPAAAQTGDPADLARLEQCGEYYGCIDYGPWPPRRPADARKLTDADQSRSRSPEQSDAEAPALASGPGRADCRARTAGCLLSAGPERL
jgi:hypothetical protein